MENTSNWNFCVITVITQNWCDLWKCACFNYFCKKVIFRPEHLIFFLKFFHEIIKLSPFWVTLILCSENLPTSYLRHISRSDLVETKAYFQCFFNIAVELKLLYAWEVIESILTSVRVLKRSSGCFLDTHDTKGCRQISSELQVCPRGQGRGVPDTQAHHSPSPQRGPTNWNRHLQPKPKQPSLGLPRGPLTPSHDPGHCTRTVLCYLIHLGWCGPKLRLLGSPCC